MKLHLFLQYILKTVNFFFEQSVQLQFTKLNYLTHNFVTVFYITQKQTGSDTLKGSLLPCILNLL